MSIENEVRKILKDVSCKSEGKLSKEEFNTILDQATQAIMEKIRSKIDCLTLRLLLRSIYLKGHQDGNLKTSDISWENKIVKDIQDLLTKTTR